MLYLFNIYYLIAPTLIIVFLMVLIGIVIPLVVKNRIQAALEDIKDEYHFILKSVKNEVYDFILENNQTKLYIKICIIPSDSAVTINSRNTWNLTYGGWNNRPGKGYSHQRYLTELVPFLEFKPETGSMKVIILYPRTNKVQKYLNESEIAIISPKDISYGYKVICFDDLKKHFRDLQ